MHAKSRGSRAIYTCPVLPANQNNWAYLSCSADSLRRNSCTARTGSRRSDAGNPTPAVLRTLRRTTNNKASAPAILAVLQRSPTVRMGKPLPRTCETCHLTSTCLVCQLLHGFALVYLGETMSSVDRAARCHLGTHRRGMCHCSRRQTSIPRMCHMHQWIPYHTMYPRLPRFY